MATATMSDEKKQNLQDTFLNHVRKHKVPVTIFLVNGVKLQGVISWFDNFCLLLRRDGQSQLVYKHAISTIMPGAAVQLYEPRRRRRAAVELSRHDPQTATRARPGAASSSAPIRRSGRPIAARRPRRASTRPWASPGHRPRRASRPRSCRCASATPATLFGTGKVDEIGARRRAPSSPSLVVDDALTPGPAAQPREGLEGQGPRPHRPDPRDLRRARARPAKACCRSSWRS